VERPRTPGILLVTAALALGGCSLTLSGPSPSRPRDRPPDCDTGKGFVASDAIVGSLLVFGSLIALANDAGSSALLPGAAGAGLVLSALSGNSKVNDCRAAIAKYDAATDDEPAPIARRPRARRARDPGAPPSAPSGVAPAPAPQQPVIMPRSPQPPQQPAPAPPQPPPPQPQPPVSAPTQPSAPTAPDVWADFWRELP
jgi:hypothetical protein